MLDCHKRSAGVCRTRFFRQWTTIALAAVGGMLIASQTTFAADDLATLAKQAQQNFQPIGDEQLSAARAELVQRADELERYLVPGSTNGENWKRYLKWDALEKQLAAEGPMELAPLAATYRQLNADYDGLELAPFRRVADALRHYVDLAAAAALTNADEFYAKQLDTLATELDQYADKPTAVLALSISRRLDFVAGLGQAPELVDAVRQKFAQPNVFVSVSSELLSAAAAEPIDRTDPVTDNILGTRIHGDAHTTGTLSLRTVPSDDRATLELTSAGHTESENTGYKGPAVIRSTGHTDFTATKIVEFSDKEFRAETAEVEATTNSDLHSVSKKGGGLGRRIVSSVGWDKAQQNHSRADAIATDHSRDRIRRRFDDEAAEKLRKARERYEGEFRHPLARRGELPDHIVFRTTEDELSFQTTQANRSQLAAPNTPPSLPNGQDLVVRVHDSAVNNYATAILGGATASETEPGQNAEFDVQLPEWMKQALEDRHDQSTGDAAGSEEPFKPWSLTFRRDRALSVEFANGGVELTIHLARLTSGEDQFTNWNVAGSFTPELKEGGVVLHRQGDLVVLPTGFDPAGGAPLSSRQVAIRSNLTKVLNERSARGRGFPESITIDVLEPKDDLAKIGPLGLGQFTSDGGWLTMAWNRQ